MKVLHYISQWNAALPRLYFPSHCVRLFRTSGQNVKNHKRPQIGWIIASRLRQFLLECLNLSHDIFALRIVYVDAVEKGWLWTHYLRELLNPNDLWKKFRSLGQSNELWRFDSTLNLVVARPNLRVHAEISFLQWNKRHVLFFLALWLSHFAHFIVPLAFPAS